MSEKSLTEADLDRMDSCFRVPEDVIALVAEVRRLREALAPFAAEWVALGRNGEEATRLVMPVRVSDCKRAKEVLSD